MGKRARDIKERGASRWGRKAEELLLTPSLVAASLSKEADQRLYSESSVATGGRSAICCSSLTGAPSALSRIKGHRLPALLCPLLGLRSRPNAILLKRPCTCNLQLERWMTSCGLLPYRQPCSPISPPRSAISRTKLPTYFHLSTFEHPGDVQLYLVEQQMGSSLLHQRLLCAHANLISPSWSEVGSLGYEGH